MCERESVSVIELQVQNDIISPEIPEDQQLVISVATYAGACMCNRQYYQNDSLT